MCQYSFIQHILLSCYYPDVWLLLLFHTCCHFLLNIAIHICIRRITRVNDTPNIFHIPDVHSHIILQVEYAILHFPYHLHTTSNTSLTPAIHNLSSRPYTTSHTPRAPAPFETIACGKRPKGPPADKVVGVWCGVGKVM